MVSIDYIVQQLLATTKLLKEAYSYTNKIDNQATFWMFYS